MADNEKNIKIFIPDYALSVMEALEKGGEQVYIVGGCVRDALLGIEPNDYDMTVSCPPERTLELLSSFRTIPTGLAHGTVTALSMGQPIEITTFRVDGSYTDSRRPDKVSFTRSVEDDLSRRDFTVNAMAYSPAASLIDLFGGCEDLKRGIIRAVGDPERRFTEDALRIMRAFRFSAQLGFDIDGDTLRGAEKCREGLSRIARERIREEMIKLICSPDPEKSLKLMVETGILPYVTGGYCPDEKIFSLLPHMPKGDIARLGLFLADAHRETASDLLNSLKCSNKQRTGALAISQNCHVAVTDATSATRLRALAGDHAYNTACASVLLGYSPENGPTLVELSCAPTRISELKIGGRELMEIGFSGRELGETLEWLLSKAMEQPELNTAEELRALAEKKIKENEKRE